MQGRQSLLTFLTVTRWSHSTSNFYVLIGQNLTGELMRKIYAASGNLPTDSWSWQSFVSSCGVLNCLFLLELIYKMKYCWYQDCSVIHGWFVFCAFCWQSTACQSHWKSDFGWHRFQKWAYSLALAWGVRELKILKRSWNTWWPLEATSPLVRLSNYRLWCVFFFFWFPEVEHMVYRA